MTVLIGLPGNMVELRDPEPSVSVPVERPGSSRTLLSGAVRTQRAPRGSRRWELSWPWLDEPDVSALIGLEQGAFGRPPWVFYDPFVAARNMLAPHVAVPGLNGDWSADPTDLMTPTSGLVIDGGMRVVSGISGTAFYRTDYAPVIAGRTYTASLYREAGDDVGIAVYWLDADGAAVSSSLGSRSTAAGRQHITAVAPVGAAFAQVGLDGGISATFSGTAFQFHESPNIQPWCPGEGIPWVTIQGLDQVYEQITDRGQDRSFSVTLIEVQP